MMVLIHGPDPFFRLLSPPPNSLCDIRSPQFLGLHPNLISFFMFSGLETRCRQNHSNSGMKLTSCGDMTTQLTTLSVSSKFHRINVGRERLGYGGKEDFDRCNSSNIYPTSSSVNGILL